MAALTVADNSTQVDVLDAAVLGNRLLGLYDRGGHVKAQRFTYINDTGAALADGSIVKLAVVGPCLILPTSTFSTSAFSSGRTLDIGTQEYVDTDGATVASNIDALADGVDVSSAVVQQTFGESTASLTIGDGLVVTGQVDILAKVIGGTLPVNGTIEGIIHYIST